MPDKKMLIDLLNVRVYLECPAIVELALRHDPDDVRQLELLQEDVKKAISSDIHTFASTLFMYRKTLAALSGNCISPLIMNAFFTASISAWADYCEYIGRQNTYEMLVQTTEYVRNGNARGAINLFIGYIEKYKRHLLSQA